MKNFLTAIFVQSHMVNEIFLFPNENVAFDFEEHKNEWQNSANQIFNVYTI